MDPRLVVDFGGPGLALLRNVAFLLAFRFLVVSRGPHAITVPPSSAAPA
jgi:hypothetical protein